MTHTAKCLFLACMYSTNPSAAVSIPKQTHWTWLLTVQQTQEHTVFIRGSHWSKWTDVLTFITESSPLRGSSHSRSKCFCWSASPVNTAALETYGGILMEWRCRSQQPEGKHGYASCQSCKCYLSVLLSGRHPSILYSTNKLSLFFLFFLQKGTQQICKCL